MDNPNDQTVTVTLPKSWLVQKHLTTIADAVAAGITQVPDSVDMWKHGLTAEQVLQAAHDLHLKISIGTGQASVNVPVGTDTEHGIDISYHLITREMDPSAVEAYHHHNEVCMKRGDDVIAKIFTDALRKGADLRAAGIIRPTTGGN